MGIMNSKNVICLLTVLFLQILVACSKNIQPVIVENTPITKNTIAVMTLTPFPTFTPSPNPIPFPTLTAQEKIDQVVKLKKDNGGCTFPCWWGITPGVTTWEEAERILSPIAVKKLAFTVESGMMYYLEFPEVSQNMNVDIFVQDDGKVDVIRFGGKYNMVDFLRDNGNPKETWISSDGIVPGPSLFRIAFFYPEKGIMAAYFGMSSLISRDGVEYIKMCVTDFNVSGPLWLWNPDSKKQFDELPIENLVGSPITLPGFPPSTLGLKRIGEYTNFDEISFFDNTVKNPEKTCLETRADIWPNPDLIITPTP
jgi:hypothetical protein